MLKEIKYLKSIVCLLIITLVLSCSSDTATSLVEKDTTPPSITTFTINNVSINDINDSIVVSTALEFNVEASDDKEVTNIDVFINNIKVASNTSSPFKLNLDISHYDSGNHTVKIAVSDEAGNTTTSKNVSITIDNTLPSITNVSISNNSILSGNTNLLSFTVSDDISIGTIEVFLDDTSLAKIANDSYEVNIPTSALNDGKHTIEIIATDSNGNSSKLNIDFTSDNTGPKIIINAIQENEIISKLINFNPEISDDFSNISSLQVLYRNQLLHSFQNNSFGPFDFNPNDYTPGDGMFTFIATDALGNTSELTINTKIAQALIHIKIPENYLSPNIMKSWVFASKSDGTPISTVKIESGMRDIVLQSMEKINETENFMVTFFEVMNNGSNRISTIQNLTLTSLETIQISPRDVFSEDSETTHPVNDFTTNETIKSKGVDYTGEKSKENSFSFKLMQPKKTDRIYIHSYDANEPSTSYRYQFLNRPVNNGFNLTKTNFSNQDVTVNNFTLQGYFPGVDLKPSLSILGFENQYNYTNNIYHELFNEALSSDEIDINSPISYPLNTSFGAYRHRLVSRDYITERKGTPLTNYNKPNWDVDYDTAHGNTIKIATNGSTHTIGRLWLKNKLSMDSSYDYNWSLVYDSQKNKSEVIIPTLPDELKNLAFYTYSEGTFWQVKQIELSRYQGISSYDEYLKKVIKNNVNYYEVSDYVESVYDVINFQEYPVLLKDLFN